MKTKEDIYKRLVEILGEEFQLESADIELSSHLYSDLDLDSIDAVDLVIKLQEITGKKINPETFKAVRTIEDVVAAIYDIVND
jgi:acyl carrier protein